MLFALIWLGLGFVCSFVAVYVFRPAGTTQRDGELYLAVLGPLFGPAVGILMALDLWRNRRRARKELPDAAVPH